MMDCHAGDLFSGGGGGETAIEAVNEAINVAINDYAATFDIDEEGVNIYVGDRDGGEIGNGDGRGDGDGGGWCGERYTKKTRRDKMLLSDLELLHYFETKLGPELFCSCQGNCLRILGDKAICTAVSSYLVWFERKSKHEQDTVIFQWMIYGNAPGGRHSLSTSQPKRREFGYHVPFDGKYLDDGGQSLARLHSHHLCTLGLHFVMGIGRRQMKSIRETATISAMMPLSRSIGQPSNAEMKADDERLPPLHAHFDYLLNLGEVRATRVVATLVDGVHGRANREESLDNVYLPISMGHRSCYKRYMLSLGFDTKCAPDGTIIVDGIVSGKPSENGYVSFSTYYRRWKTAYPQLKVCRPAEDICGYCFVFANRHRYLANHSAVAIADCSDDDADVDGDDEPPADDYVPGSIDEQLMLDMSTISLEHPEAAATQAEEARETLLIAAAKHI
jgi:hypothetical protein